MNIPEIIDATISGYCDLDTGECITVDPIIPDDQIATDNGDDSERVLPNASSDGH